MVLQFEFRSEIVVLVNDDGAVKDTRVSWFNFQKANLLGFVIGLWTTNRRDDTLTWDEE